LCVHIRFIPLLTERIGGVRNELFLNLIPAVDSATIERKDHKENQIGPLDRLILPHLYGEGVGYKSVHGSKWQRRPAAES
jgi:hypothetical protein